MTKKKRNRRDKESKKDNNASAAPGCDDAGGSGSASTAAAERGEDEKVLCEEEDYLCTFICDLLADLPRSSNQCWDQEICGRISVGLKKCHLHLKDSLRKLNDSDVEDVVTIDIRGRYVDDARSELIMHLCRCSQIPNAKYLKVIVGCKVHGAGKGKLRQAITQLLARDNTIVWEKENGGSVISIKIDDEKDYSSLEWYISEKRQLFGPFQGFSKDPLSHFMEAEASEEVEEDFLCTFICDFLSGIPKFGTCWDSKMCKRISAGVSRCDRAEEEREIKFYKSNGIIVDTLTIGLEGQYVEDALPFIKQQLYHLSCMCTPVSALRFLNVRVGCKTHGAGKGKLKQAVIDMLDMEEDLKWREEYRGSVISIELDGRSVFNFFDEDSYFMHEGFGDLYDALL